METTLNIPEDLLKEAMQVSKSRIRIEAVIAGLKELIRQRGIERILSSVGRLEFSTMSDTARHGR